MIFLPKHVGQLVSFAVGFLGFGLVPLLLYQKEITGSYFQTTYDTPDLEQSFSSIKVNLQFYYGLRNYLVPTAAEIVGVLFLAFVALVWKRSRAESGFWRRWMLNRIGLVLAAPCVVVISCIYFLTHKIPIIYYPIPTIAMASLLLTLLVVSIELDWRGNLSMNRRFGIAALAACLGIGILVATGACNWREWVSSHESILRPRPPNVVSFTIPAEMQNPKAWIWSDEFAGSIRFYTGHPAFNLYACSSAARAVIYNAVSARREPQYVVVDSVDISYLVNDMRAKGFQMAPVGNIFGATCFRMTPGR